MLPPPLTPKQILFPMNSNGSTKGTLSRRAFIASGVAALVVPRQVLRAAGNPAPSDQLRIACVGVGGVGQDYVAGCRDEEIVALCDLDHEYSALAFQLYPRARIYQDFRQMFDKEEKNFDALIVATPDHWHSHLVLAGLAMNKHIYCAKPITRTIAEARQVKAAVLASQVTTKASIQDSRTSPARATTELLLSGAIGPIREVHFWTGTHCSSGLARPTEIQTPPAGMNWDQWCGPSPARPYHKIYHYGNWRPWWDFGTGNLGDVACHALHVFHNELEMGAPDWVAGNACQATVLEGRVANTECASIANYVQWHFPARGKHPEMMAYFYDGGLQPPRPLSMPTDMGMPGRGLMFVGDNGVLVSAFYGGSPWLPDHVQPRPGQRFRGLPGGQLLPESRFKDFKQPEPYLPRCERPDHYAEWIRACKAGKKSITPVELACDWTEFALLGSAMLRRYSTPERSSTPVVPTGTVTGGGGRSDSAVVWISASNDGHVHVPAARPLANNGTRAMYWRTSKVLLWDAKAMRFTNDEVANGFVDTPCRKEWDYKV
jgi:predicted dehydrogenase